MSNPLINNEAIAAQNAEEPLQVFLFSGHMIDRPDRPQPRFPPAMETEAQQKIKEVLDRLKADASNLAIAPGIACGGDILFLESCLQRQMKAEIYLPFEPAKFIEQSVSFAGNNWVERFYQIKNHPQVKIHLQLEQIQGTGRFPLHLIIQLDDQVLLDEIYQPQGIRNDGVTFVLEKIKIRPGTHTFSVQVDDGGEDQLRTVLEETVAVQPGQVIVVGSDPVKEFVLFKE